MASFGLFVYCTSISCSWNSACSSLVLRRYSLSDSQLPWNFQSAWTISSLNIDKLRCRYLSDLKEFFFFFDSRMSLLKSIIQKTSEKKHPKIMDLRKGTKWAGCQQSSCWYARTTLIFSKMKCNSNHQLFYRETRGCALRMMGLHWTQDVPLCGGRAHRLSLSHYLETTFTLACCS